MDLPTALSAGLAQSIEETLVIGVVPEDLFSAISSIHEVIDCTRIPDPQPARHAQQRVPTILTIDGQD